MSSVGRVGGAGPSCQLTRLTARSAVSAVVASRTDIASPEFGAGATLANCQLAHQTPSRGSVVQYARDLSPFYPPVVVLPKRNLGAVSLLILAADEPE